MSPDMTRRMLQNVAAIEKDLNLVPTVSNQIGTIHELEDECELSDTNKTRKEFRLQKILFANQETDSPDFPKRESTDEVHKAEHFFEPNYNMTQLEFKPTSFDDGEQRFEECLIDYQVNPFGRAETVNSRQYIDDMTSSSGNLSGLSENADCFPIVEQV